MEIEEYKPIYEVLKRLTEKVDPKTIIAGGCAINLLNKTKPNDVDVYLTSPFSTHIQLVNLIRDVLSDFEGIDIKIASTNTYYSVKTAHKITILYKGFEFQVMHVKTINNCNLEQFANRVFKTFDIDICKVFASIRTNRNNPQFLKFETVSFSEIGTGIFIAKTPEYQKCEEEHTLYINLTKSGPYQKYKTLTSRLDKYKLKYPDYDVNINGMIESTFIETDEYDDIMNFEDDEDDEDSDRIRTRPPGYITVPRSPRFRSNHQILVNTTGETLTVDTLYPHEIVPVDPRSLPED